MNEEKNQRQKQIPTTVFSGFLGSGKTTIISHLIDELQKKEIQVAYIKNEIGDTDIDTQLLKGKDIQTKELLNGCICCTLVGPFATAVTELIESFKPDRIIIEASGAADPSALALMIGSHPQLLRDGMLSIVDVENFEGYKDLSVTAQNQTQFTDIIIFNKVENVSIQQKKAVVGYVRELNTHSPIIEAPNGIVNPEVVFGLDPANLAPFLKEHVHSDSDHDHIHADNFSAFTLRTHQALSQEDVESLLAATPKSIFRTKGIFKTPSNTWLSYNGVGTKYTFAPVSNPENFTESVFVFIGIHADEYEDQMRQKLIELSA